MIYGISENKSEQQPNNATLQGASENLQIGIQNSICIMKFRLMKLAISFWETGTVAVKLNAEMFLGKKNECTPIPL